MAVKDLDKLRDQFATLKPEERDDVFFQKLLIKTHIKLYAVHAITQNLVEALSNIEKLEQDFVNFIDPKLMEKIKKDKLMIENRKQSEDPKNRADNFLRNNNSLEAKEIYKQILEIDPKNEKVLSNLSLIYLNEENWNECTTLCSEIIKLLKSFKDDINLRKYDSSFEIKILLRRAKCYEKIEELSNAQEDIEAVEKLEIRNELIFKDINKIKESLKVRLLDKYKENANSLLEKGYVAEALELYDKSLSLVKYLPKIDQIKLYLNRCSCLIKLGKFENVFNECSRILITLEKQKNIALINSNNDLLEKAQNLEFLTYVKRAFCYVQSNKPEDAINDYTLALKLKPHDEKIKENLSKLKMSL